MADLRERIIQAQGGERALAGVTEVMARASFGGWDFSARLATAPRDVDVSVRLMTAEVCFNDYPRPGQNAWFSAHRTWIEDADGKRLTEREAPGAVLRSVGHWFNWDPLDVVYYCGFTLWQALSVPFLLLRDELCFEAMPDRVVAGKRLQRLQASSQSSSLLPAGDLLLYADASGLLLRVDSASPTGSSWSCLAQLCEGHESVEGAVLATRRRLHPCLGGQWTWSLLPLVWLELDDLGLTRGGR